MKRNRIIILVSIIIILNLGIGSFAGEVLWEEASRGIQDVEKVLVHPDNARIIYAGLKGGIFKSEDGGKSYRPVLSLKGDNRQVNYLLFSPKNTGSLYAATSNGLFYSNNQGKNWQRIFRGSDTLESECTAIGVLPDTIYLGTKQGLFTSKDNGARWYRVSGKLNKSPILAIAYNLKDPDYIYIASTDGVFRTPDAGKSWERVFVTHPVEDGDDEEEKNEDGDEEERFSNIRSIVVDPKNLNSLYLATSRGVYKSQDKGTTWQSLSSYGLLDRDVKSLLIGEGLAIYAATKSAVFAYKQGRWQELSFGLTATRVESIYLDGQGNLYASCNNGLFKARINNPNVNGQGNILEIFYKEGPGIKEVQQAAIQYAEVSPEKIKLWRKLAARKALLPDVSTNVGRNVTDLWHWESGSTTKTGDDILLRGRDAIDWSVSLSWDLGDLIWSDSQTSIDVRSRLTTQLRADILDEVTRVYFERIRIKMELDSLNIEDRKERLEKELRLQELAAILDALTGGLFSRRPEKK